MEGQAAPASTLSVLDEELVGKFLKYRVGDTIECVVRGRVDSISSDSARIVVDGITIDPPPKPRNLQEAAKRVLDRSKYVASRVEPAIG